MFARKADTLPIAPCVAAFSDVAGQMYNWTGQYMHNRKAKVQGKPTFLQKEDPQGRRSTRWKCCMSSTLFFVFIPEILHRMPKNIQGTIYTDDLALRCSEEYITIANYRLQQARQVIEIFFFFVPQLYLWGSPLLGEISAYVTVF